MQRHRLAQDQQVCGHLGPLETSLPTHRQFASIAPIVILVVVVVVVVVVAAVVVRDIEKLS